MANQATSLYRHSIGSFTLGGLSGALVVAAIPWLMLQRGYSATLAAWMIATPSIGFVAVAMLSHRYINRLPLRKSLFAGFSLQTIGLSGMILSETFDRYTLGAAFLLLLTVGISSQLIANSTYTRVTAITGENNPFLLRRRHALINTISQFMAFGGGVLGVALSGIIPLTAIASVAIVCTIVGIAVAWRLPEQQREPLEAGHEYGLWDALAKPSLLRSFLFIGIFWNIGVTFYAGLQSAWLYESVKATTGQASIFFACSAIGTISSGFILSRTRWANKTLMMVGFSVQSCAIVGFAVMNNIWIACALIFMCMSANTTIASVLINTRIAYADASGVSSVLNTSQLYNRLAGLLCGLFVGAIIAYSVYWVLFSIAAFSLVIIVVFLWRLDVRTPQQHTATED